MTTVLHRPAGARHSVPSTVLPERSNVTAIHTAEQHSGRALAQSIAAVAKGLLWAIAITAAAIIVVSGLLPRVIGAVPLTVLSGSMEPAFSPGDLIVSQPVDADTVQTGDIITFQPISGDPTLVTHRVIGFAFGEDGARNVITQGDANDVPDAAIEPDQVMGTMLYSVPYIGYVSSWVDRTHIAWALPFAGVVLIAVALAAALRAARTRAETVTEDAAAEIDTAS